MPGASSNEAEWYTLLTPTSTEAALARRDDPRLGELIEAWAGDPESIEPGRAVLLGFPQDEGVRRNHGRTGAAQAPGAVRRWLRRLTVSDAAHNIDLRPPLDLGDLRVSADLEQSQERLGRVVAAILQRGAIPIVVGGGHETAYGHYLGYVAESRRVGIINIDAHLDVRPLEEGRGHSGSPFRQAMTHSTCPLPGSRYVCLGAQPHATSKEHWQFATSRGAVVRWRDELRLSLAEQFVHERDRLAADGCGVYVTIDADVVRMADVPGVSAPNPVGLPGEDVLALARRAGQSAVVSSLDLVEINPCLDRDGQSARWAALVIWKFLAGLAARNPSCSTGP